MQTKHVGEEWTVSRKKKVLHLMSKYHSK